MSNRTILAVDPGQSGAVAVLSSPKVIGKTITGGLLVKRDFKTLQDIARAVLVLSPGVTEAVIEAVHAFPGQGVVSVFSFGRSTGVAFGALEVSLPGVILTQVSPQKWQNFFRGLLGILKDEEFDSRLVAMRVMPDSTQFLARKKDHGTADALLMAIWKVMSEPQSIS